MGKVQQYVLITVVRINEVMEIILETLAYSICRIWQNKKKKEVLVSVSTSVLRIGSGRPPRIFK